MKLLNEALDRVRSGLIEKIENNGFGDFEYRYRGESDYNYFGLEDTVADSIARLRLDWEIRATVDTLSDDLVKLMLTHIGADLEDLIVNGDVDNTRDALLKTMDGSKKRRQEPVNIDVFCANIYRTYVKRKKAFEYTLYVLLAVDWQ